MKIDIILPIYNSPTETQNCIESVIKETPSDSYNLHLLDDCSTDPQISVITNYFSEKYSNIYSYKNEQNKGFPENVNIGIKRTFHDIVLLNSDTIVTEGWLEGLYRASMSDSKIAAVNPLSNYGVISSVPSIYQEANDTLSIIEIVNFLKKRSSIIYPEIPVLIGYCMYIKRSVIDEIGTLDAETFKRGYGEEVDWCLRAREKGYKLVIADDVFVKHIGGTSFGPEKVKLRELSASIIREKYPNYESEIKILLNNHPLKTMRKEMSRELKVSLKYQLRYYMRQLRTLMH